MVTWSCQGFLSAPVLTSTPLAWNLTACSPLKTCVVLFPMSLRELVFWGWWNAYLWTSLRYFVAIFPLFSQSLSIVLCCGGRLLNITFCFSSLRCIRWSDFVPIRVSCLCVIDVLLLGWIWFARLILTRITVCSASFHLHLSEFDIHKLQLQLIH